LIGALSGVVGVLLAMAGVSSVQRLAPTTLPRLAEIEISARVLLFAIATSIVTSIAFGLVPAIHTARADIAGVLRAGGRGASRGKQHRRLQEMLVVLQVAFAIVLIASATLLIRGFLALQRTRVGIEPQGVLAAQVSLPRTRYVNDQRRADYATRLESALLASPGVQAIALADALPALTPTSMLQFDVPGRVAKDPTDTPAAFAVSISPGYFDALGIRVVRGRVFTDRDRPDAPPVVIVDELLASRYFPGVDPVGRRIAFPDEPGSYEIVGLVTTVKQGGPESDDRPVLYTSLAQRPADQLQIAIRIDERRGATASALTTRLREVGRAVDPQAPILDIAPMEVKLAGLVAPNRFYAVVATAFGSIALVLGAIGLYGMLAYTVSQRTREIGVRIALGASPAAVRRSVIRDGLVLACIGIIAGAVGALALGKFLRGILASVGMAGASSLLLSAIVFAAVAIVAALVPAARAAGVDPLVAMRGE
jgi:predicted permease